MQYLSLSFLCMSSPILQSVAFWPHDFARQTNPTEPQFKILIRRLLRSPKEGPFYIPRVMQPVLSCEEPRRWAPQVVDVHCPKIFNNESSRMQNIHKGEIDSTILPKKNVFLDLYSKSPDPPSPPYRSKILSKIFRFFPYYSLFPIVVCSLG